MIVATDDRRIADAVSAFGGDVRMTSEAHQSGTDRLAEVAASLNCDLVVNVQGDEPLIEPEMIDEAVRPFALDASLEMSTLRKLIDDPADRHNPNVTKVVVDDDDFALYFSRAPIPFTRDGCPPAPAWRHIGLYVYRRETLLRLARLTPTALERAEALSSCMRSRSIRTGVETACDSIADTPADRARAGTVAARASVSAGECAVTMTAGADDRGAGTNRARGARVGCERRTTLATGMPARSRRRSPGPGHLAGCPPHPRKMQMANVTTRVVCHLPFHIQAGLCQRPESTVRMSDAPRL